MALENLNEVEKALGLEEGKLAEMITSEEAHTLDLSGKIILDKTSYEERIENLKKESAKSALEIAIKEQRNALGLEFQGKTMDNLVNAIKSKVEAESKVEPEEKFKNLKSDFEKLQGKLSEKENELVTFKTTIEKERAESEIRNAFTKHIPDNTLVSKSTIFTEAREKGFSFEKEDGKIVVKSNGEVVKNENFSPVDIADWVSNFVTPYIAKVDGGRGKGDETPPSKAGSFEAFEAEATKNGWNDTQKNVEMAKRLREGTLKL